MNCPNDNSELRMSERNGVEIDYCPQCRDVWLDRDLDKTLDRSSAIEEEWRRPREQRERARYDTPRHPSKSKRKSFLNEFFDL
jgi:Zn-finger nucleic acid-binding protein